MKIAFICVHNSCRSQIAEALCRRYRPDLTAYSAGTEIKQAVNPDAVRIMREIYGIDMSFQRPKQIKDIPACDRYYSMGCGVGCPFAGREYDGNFMTEDPTGKSDACYIEAIEKIKSEIMKI